MNMKGKNKYKCKHCKITVERECSKKWIRSYCTLVDKYVRLYLVK